MTISLNCQETRVVKDYDMEVPWGKENISKLDCKFIFMNACVLNVDGAVIKPNKRMSLR